MVEYNPGKKISIEIINLYKVETLCSLSFIENIKTFLGYIILLDKKVYIE